MANFPDPVTLKDVGINVFQGSSPFSNFTDKNNPNTQTGLLAQGNSSITSAGLPVRLVSAAVLCYCTGRSDQWKNLASFRAPIMPYSSSMPPR
jgi:hypothetical protein